jgi:hypothetical protein
LRLLRREFVKILLLWGLGWFVSDAMCEIEIFKNYFTSALLDVMTEELSIVVLLTGTYPGVHSSGIAPFSL